MASSLVHDILDILESTYPDPTTELNHESPFQLLIATILSAQCTDERVNIITKEFFRDHPTVESMAQLRVEEIGDYIKSAGLWQTKARNIYATCRKILQEHNGQVPCTMEELTALPGVGRKTANVVLSVAFGIPAIAVDTHVFRVANRLGMAEANTPEQTEKQLMGTIPQEKWSDAHHWLIFHGRRVCKARKPLCDQCPLQHLCPSSQV